MICPCLSTKLNFFFAFKFFSLHLRAFKFDSHIVAIIANNGDDDGYEIYLLCIWIVASNSHNLTRADANKKKNHWIKAMYTHERYQKKKTSRQANALFSLQEIWFLDKRHIEYNHMPSASSMWYSSLDLFTFITAFGRILCKQPHWKQRNSNETQTIKLNRNTFQTKRLCCISMIVTIICIKSD